MTLVVFATNIRPQELVDEAFLRRIHYKVLCGEPDARRLRAHLRNYCVTEGRGVRPRRSSRTCCENYYKPRNIALRGCHPRDLIEQALSLAEYLGRAAAS